MVRSVLLLLPHPFMPACPFPVPTQVFTHDVQQFKQNMRNSNAADKKDNHTIQLITREAACNGIRIIGIFSGTLLCGWEDALALTQRL